MFGARFPVSFGVCHSLFHSFKYFWNPSDSLEFINLLEYPEFPELIEFFPSYLKSRISRILRFFFHPLNPRIYQSFIVSRTSRIVRIFSTFLNIQNFQNSITYDCPDTIVELLEYVEFLYYLPFSHFFDRNYWITSFIVFILL